MQKGFLASPSGSTVISASSRAAQRRDDPEIVGRVTFPWIATPAFGLLAMTPPWSFFR